MDSGETASGLASLAGLDVNFLAMLTPEGAVPGTGLLPLSATSTEQLGPLPQAILDVVVTELPALFGDYPSSSDKAPAAIFIVFNALLALGSLYIFFKNTSAGHKYYGTLLIFFYAICKLIGFSVRLQWSKNIMQIQTGIASTVFTQTPPLILNALILNFATRILTWRHPRVGRSALFRGQFVVIYGIVLGCVIMAILGTGLPYIYYMSQETLDKCHQVAKAAAILELFFCINGILVVLFAYAFKPGSLDGLFTKKSASSPLVIQPTWIERFSTFYYVTKGSHIPVYKGSALAEAHAVIPVRESPAGGNARVYSTDTNHFPSIRSHISIVFITSFFLTLSACFRVASVFITKPRGGGQDDPIVNAIFHKSIFYVFYGAVELLVAAFLLVVRVDLRFYIPDHATNRKAGDPESPAIETFEGGFNDQSEENLAKEN
ncbi:hypothetical protein TRVA0_094S00122 [Trichomonascus vanleenenianus]|uniref:uncharacterized protein n=1 Tax=Trichomonascus vanleenenianus TaxID=2268995 RepID=UPI003EC9DFB8